MRYLNNFFMETWDGWFFVLVNAVVMLFFVFLGNMGRGLMKGKMKIATKTWFWVIFIIYLVIQFFIGIGMYFYPHILPALISTHIMIAGVILNIRAKRTNKLADAINENRVNNLEVTQEISSVIKKDNPAEILVMEDGIILFSAVATPEFKFDPASYGYTDVTPNGNSVKYATGTSMRVPKNIKAVPNVTRVIRYEEYGYQMMDDNTKRAFANVLAKGLGNYNISESEHTHQEEHTQISSDSRATVYGNGSGSYSVYGGKDGYSTTVTSTHTDGFTYVLIRKDLDQVQVKQEKVKDEGPKLKSW